MPDPRQLTQPRAIAVAAQKFLGVDANSLYPQLLDRKTKLPLRQEVRRPEGSGMRSSRRGLSE